MDSGGPLVASRPARNRAGAGLREPDAVEAAPGGVRRIPLPGQIVGMPAWATTIRFDINAIAAGDPPRRQMNEMARQLFADRFKLRVRIEPRDMDVYALVLHRGDGRLGPRLKRSTADCAAIRAAGAPTDQSQDPTNRPV